EPGRLHHHAHRPAPRGQGLGDRWARGVDVEEILAERRAESPLGALVTPDQVGWAVATLLDPEAGALTGSTLALDMGARRGL
ncbi:MAG TPA: SDR family oxidoreductase, partial [Actinomycetospora sp.]|nr:SDR family oxidoreductase [Actinomycetospora sp.]